MAMAAANQPLPGLHVTAPDEDMEISDYERSADDIDIDIDLTVEPSNEEDDYMVDDRSEHENKDDIMIDGDGDDEDGMMQDNVSLPDEHLTDASDMGYVDAEVKEEPHDQEVTDHVDLEVQDRGQTDDFIDYDDSVEAQPKTLQQPATQQPDDLHVPEQTAVHDFQDQNAHEQNIEAGAALSDAQVQADEQKTHQATEVAETPHSAAKPPLEEHKDAGKAVEPETDSATAQPVEETKVVDITEDVTRATSGALPADPLNASHVDDVQATGDDSVPNASEQENVPEPAAELSEGVVDFPTLPFDPQNNAEVQSSRADYLLHPVIVVYHGDEISLFPPSDGDTSDTFYFLQDESLAQESIQRLLHACRQILGETVRDDDELELDIAELGLCVSEDSHHAANTSFAQILNVYVQLRQNDGVQTPDPLYVTLNTKTRFSARLDALLGAIADGRGISQLTFLDDAAEEESYLESEGVQDEEAQAEPSDEQQKDDGDITGPEHVSNHGVPSPDEHAGLVNDDAEQVQEAGADHVQENGGEPEQEAVAAAVPSVTHAKSDDLPPTTQETSEAQDHASSTPPSAHDVPADESSPEEENVTGEHIDNPASTANVSLAEDSPEDDQIDYDDGEDVENAEEVKDDASFRSSTVRGDNTPATVGGNTPQQDNAQHEPKGNHDQVSTSIAGLPQDGFYPAGDNENPEVDSVHAHQVDESSAEDAEAHGKNFDDAGNDDDEGYYADEQSQRQAEGGQDQQYEPEPNEQDGFLNYNEELSEYDPADFTWAGEEEYGQEQEEDVHEASIQEGTTEEYVVVEAEDARYDLGQTRAVPANDDLGHHSRSHEFDDTEADATADNDLSGIRSKVEENPQQAVDDQARPNTDASGEDDLDTIDYDDEELSQPASPASRDGTRPAVSIAPSPSSAKRGWEELGQGEDDDGNMQAPKKVKSD